MGPGDGCSKPAQSFGDRGWLDQREPNLSGQGRRRVMPKIAPRPGRRDLRVRLLRRLLLDQEPAAAIAPDLAGSLHPIEGHADGLLMNIGFVRAIDESPNVGGFAAFDCCYLKPFKNNFATPGRVGAGMIKRRGT